MKNRFPTLWTKDQTGFIALPVLVIILLSITVLGGGGYGIYKMNQIQTESDNRVAQLEKKLDFVTSSTSEIETVETSTSTQSEIVNLENVSKSSPVTNFEKPRVVSSKDNHLSDLSSQTQIVKEVVSKGQSLTQDDRNRFMAVAQNVISSSDSALRALESRMAYIRKSKYRGEYLDVERAILETKKIFEADKRMAEIIILASQNVSEDKYSELNSAFNVFINSANETADEGDYMFASIDNLLKLSNEIVEDLIKLEVIDELSAKYGVSSYGSSDVQTSSTAISDASKKADDYLKTLVSKYDDEKEINNYLIGIVVIY